MILLIDFENVHSDGFTGYMQLNRDDEITIFYSNAAKKLERGIFRTIVGHGCEISVVKLRTTAKNALDFYIATKVGELMVTRKSEVAIISKDVGYKAVLEYWNQIRKSRNNLILASSIAEAKQKEINAYYGDKKETIDEMFDEYRNEQATLITPAEFQMSERESVLYEKENGTWTKKYIS